MNSQIERIDSFFKEYNILDGKKYTDGSHNQSVDGSGKLPSVNEKEAKQILKFLLKNNPVFFYILDVGAGLGYLQKYFSDILHCNSFEGSNSLSPFVVCDKSKYAIADLSKPFSDHRLYKAFDLSTSFEVFEHIHRDHLDQFITNLRFLSNYHFCSIHTANEEHDLHCTIMQLHEWCDLFNKHGIYYQILGTRDTGLHTDNFHKEIGLDTWNCSIFLMLKL